MSFSIRIIRTRFSPRSGKCGGSRGFFPAAAPGSGLYRSIDGGNNLAAIAGQRFAGWNSWPHRRERFRRGFQSHLRHHRSERRRHLPVRRWRKNWTKINDDGRFRQRAWYFSKIYADPKAPSTPFMFLNTGAFRSVDGGKTFTLFPARHGDHHGLWIDPKNPERLANANDGGASVSNRWRQDMDDAGEPADRAVLSRRGGQRVSVSHLRRATG